MEMLAIGFFEIVMSGMSSLPRVELQQFFPVDHACYQAEFVQKFSGKFVDGFRILLVEVVVLFLCFVSERFDEPGV